MILVQMVSDLVNPLKLDASGAKNATRVQNGLVLSYLDRTAA
jgi:hypothetical protein